MDNARFCKNCGINLDTMQENVNAHQVNTQQFMAASEESHTVAIVIGYILAILIPLLGLVAAIYLLTRDNSPSAKRHGKYVLIVTVIVWILSIISIFH